MAYFNKNSAALDYITRSERLCVPFAIVYNATPALKTNSNDLSQCVVLSLEGQTATAAAIDSGTNFITPVDSTGNFGILIYNLGVLSKLLKAEVINLSSGTCTTTYEGASNTGITASGNIAVSIDWNGNLATTSLSATVCVDYILNYN